MHSRLRSFILIYFFLLSFGPLSSQQLFHRTYSSPNEDNPEHAIPLPDGGIVICGDVISQNPYLSRVFLTRLDSSGNPLWINYYFATQAHATKVFLAGDGGYYVSGYAYFAPSAWGFYLMKTDSAGHQEWLKLFAGSGPSDVKRTSDGGFVYTGSVLMMPWSTTSVCKVDSMGNVQWWRAYFRDEPSNSSAIEQTYDGGYLVTGSTRSFGFSTNAVMYVMKLDSVGNVNWNKVLTDTFGINQGIGKSIVRSDRDSTYSIACLLPYLSLITLKQDFTVASVKFIYPSGNAMAHDISLTTDGGYLLTAENNGQACVMKLDSARNVMWYKNFESLNMIYYSSSLTSFESDTGIYWSVTNNSLNGGDVNVCRYTQNNTMCDSTFNGFSTSIQLNVLDSLFAVQNGSNAAVLDTFVEQTLTFSNVYLCNSQLDAIDQNIMTTGFRVFPNPTNSFLTIEYPVLTRAVFELYNSIGELVFTGIVSNYNTTIDVSSFPPGIYYSMVHEGDKMFSKVVVIE